MPTKLKNKLTPAQMKEYNALSPEDQPKYLKSLGIDEDYDPYSPGWSASSSDAPSETDELLMSALDMSERQFRENQAEIDRMVEEGVPAYEKAGDMAQWANVLTILNVIREEKGLPSIKPEKFVGKLESQAAKAKADPEAIRAQKDALRQLGERTDPKLTAKEQAIIEINRRTQEQELRGAREAALTGARQRGFGGAGMAMQQTLAAQQEGAERRMLEDLGASGMAVDRAEAALRDYGALAGDVREQSFGEKFKTGSAADSIGMFNKELEQDYQKYRTKTLADENRDVWGREKDIAGMKFGAIADAYNYETEPLRFKERATGMRVGEGGRGAGETSRMLSALAGSKQAEAAAAQLREDADEFNLANTSTW
jgi:hypothetical protein